MVLSCFEPTPDRILSILDGFKFRLAVRHAAGKFRHCREKASTVLSAKRFDNRSTFRTLAHFSLSARRLPAS